jgi:hypothetical protein
VPGYVEAVPLGAGGERAAQPLLAAERLPQVRDVRAQRDRGLRRGSAVPELVDQPLGRDDPSDVHQQQHQQCTLPARGDLHLRPVEHHAQRTENREADPRLLPAHHGLTPPAPTPTRVDMRAP